MDNTETSEKSWDEWLIECLSMGCDYESIIDSMVTSGQWKEQDARRALRKALTTSDDDATPSNSVLLPVLPEQRSIRVDDIDIEVTFRNNTPCIALIENILTPEECQEILDYIKDVDLENSEVVDEKTGNGVLHYSRTSSSHYFETAETPLIQKLERRISAITRWPETHAESLQLLKYEKDQEFKPHHDYFEGEDLGSYICLERGGQRVATMIIYLTEPEIGGGTSFPHLGYTFYPRRGSAVYFLNLNANGNPDTSTLHSGDPVKKGTKVVLTCWQRENTWK